MENGILAKIREEQFEEAAALIGALHQKPEQDYYRGLLARKKGLVLKSIAYLESALSHWDKAEVHGQLGEIYLGQEVYEEAVYHFQQALLQNPDRKELIFLIFDCFLGLGLSREAIVEQMTQFFSLKEEASWIFFINLLVDKGFYLEAQRLLEVDKVWEMPARRLYLQGRCQFYLKNYSVALTYFHEAAKLTNSKHVRAYLLILKALKCPGWEDAMDWTITELGLLSWLETGLGTFPILDGEVVSLLKKTAQDLDLLDGTIIGQMV